MSAQALETGFSERDIRLRVQRGRWHDVLPGVIASADTPLTWERKLRAACLWTRGRGFASHRSAAALWRLEGFERDIVEISIIGGFRAPAPWLTVHRLPLESEVPRCMIEGYSTTTISRTLLDVAGVVRMGRLEDGLDDALRRGLTSIAWVSELLQQDGNARRRGAGRLRKLLAERGDGDPLWESKFERKLFRVLASAGLPVPTRQYEIRSGGVAVARVDFAYPEHKVAIEADGYRYHSGRRAWKRDMERQERLVRLGWRVIRVTYEDLRDNPAGVVARILEVLALPLVTA